MADAPVEASTPHVNEFALSDASGQIHFVLNVDDSDPQIVVRLWSGRGFDLPIAEAIEAQHRYDALRSAYAFPWRVVVPAVPGQSVYSVELAGKPAISLAGRFIDEAGLPLSGSVGVLFFRTTSAYIGPESNGAFQLSGVPRGHAITLVFMTEEYRVYLHEVSSNLTAEPIDLGNIEVDMLPADATVDIEMVNGTDFFDSADEYLGDSLTLVRKSDGVVIHCFSLNALGKAASFSMDTPLGAATTVPAGEYYTSPGTLGHAAPLALVAAVRDGRQAALDAAGVPQITAVAGQTTSLTFDARAAAAAIESVADDLMP
jgi:hypothetical protein